MKRVISLVMIMCMIVTLTAEKRKPFKFEKDLNDPESPFYAPVINPQTDEDIIKDLNHLVKIHLSMENRDKNGKIFTPPEDFPLQKYINGEPGYRVGRIIKVKNFFSRYSHDYSFLAELINPGGLPFCRLAVSSFGHGLGIIYFPEAFGSNSKGRKLGLIGQNLKDNPVLTFLIDGGKITQEDVDQAEAVMYADASFCSDHTPAYVVKNQRGVKYMINRDGWVWEVEGETKLTPEEVKTQSFREAIRRHSVYKDTLVLHDSINDILLVLKKIYLPKKSQD